MNNSKLQALVLQVSDVLSAQNIVAGDTGGWVVVGEQPTHKVARAGPWEVFLSLHAAARCAVITTLLYCTHASNMLSNCSQTKCTNESQKRNARGNRMQLQTMSYSYARESVAAPRIPRGSRSHRPCRRGRRICLGRRRQSFG